MFRINLNWSSSFASFNDTAYHRSPQSCKIMSHFEYISRYPSWTFIDWRFRIITFQNKCVFVIMPGANIHGQIVYSEIILLTRCQTIEFLSTLFPLFILSVVYSWNRICTMIRYSLRFIYCHLFQWTYSFSFSTWSCWYWACIDRYHRFSLRHPLLSWTRSSTVQQMTWERVDFNRALSGRNFIQWRNF